MDSNPAAFAAWNSSNTRSGKRARTIWAMKATAPAITSAPEALEIIPIIRSNPSPTPGP